MPSAVYGFDEFPHLFNPRLRFAYMYARHPSFKQCVYKRNLAGDKFRRGDNYDFHFSQSFSPLFLAVFQ